MVALEQVLGFDMDVKHPHHYLLHIVRELEGDSVFIESPLNGGNAGSDELAATAYYIVNDR